MTLILTLATPKYILQVSDRLLTRGTTEFDARSNKNVVYLARNAIVTLGYSGMAYLDGRPTDHWAAAKVSGQELEGQFALRTSVGISPNSDIGTSVKRLSEACTNTAAAMRLPRNPALQFTLAGWQWRKHVARPILINIENSAAHPRTFTEQSASRYWHYKAGYPLLLTAIPDSNPLERAGIRRLASLLAYCAGNADAAEDVMVKAIRVASARSSVVGSDCMSVLIPPPSVFLVRVRYFPRKPGQPGLAFTPWVVGGGLAIAPSAYTGGFSAHVGGFEIRFEAPPPTAGAPLAVISSQRRPHPPGATSR